MKALRYLISLTALSSVILIGVACATSDAPIGDPQPAEQNATEPPAKIPENAPPPPAEKPPEKKCAATCEKDEDCQNSCPSVPSGQQNCCDLSTKKCWKAAAAVCPVPAEAGAPPSY